MDHGEKIPCLIPMNDLIDLTLYSILAFYYCDIYKNAKLIVGL